MQLSHNNGDHHRIVVADKRADDLPLRMPYRRRLDASSVLVAALALASIFAVTVGANEITRQRACGSSEGMLSLLHQISRVLL